MDKIQPLRVFLVERPRVDGGLAKHLLSNYDMDFTWECAASPQKLLKLATDFKPDIVLCSDDTRGLIAALRLLSSRPPVILVSSLRDAAAPPFRQVTDVLLDTLRAAPELSLGECADHRTSRDDGDDSLRRSFARVLEANPNPAVMSDSDGWITFANISACRLLGRASGSHVGTLLDEPGSDACAPHWLDLAREANRGNDQFSGPFGVACSTRASAPRIHRLALFDPGYGRPTPLHVDALIGRIGACTPIKQPAFTLVATHLGSARISDDEACCVSLSGAEPNGAACEDEPQRPMYGSVVRVTAHDYLLALPAPCSALEAAFTAQRVLESITAATEATPDAVAEAVSTAAATTSAAPAPALGAGLKARSSLQVSSRESGRRRLELDLADALRRHALSVQYQPQYEVGTGRGCGVEALVRWVLSSGETVSPSRFVPIAERSGMIHELGAWVLRSACEAGAIWCSKSAPLSTLSVNVSALQIDEHFCSVLISTLKHSGFPGNRLELEITESALIRNTERTIEYLKEWKRLGIRIAVDDFGTGYSSLSYLSQLPVDRLKLDQSLIRRMTVDSKGAAVARSIVCLGAELGVDVMAEGVETEEQLQMLANLGCPTVQGYLLGRPMSATQAQVVLRKTWGNRPHGPCPGFRPAAAADVASHVH
jgi:EAL domain-containing protein (putative c-di-GMP-specific phosphodiesterase class I)/PAS domain-containing protein